MNLADNAFEAMWFGEDDPVSASEQAAGSLAAAVAKASGLKPFPQAAQRVLSMMSNPDFEVEAVGKVIETDPAMAASVLRVANSALFSGTRPCLDVKHAVIRLGAEEVKNILIGVAVMGMFNDSHGLGKVIKDHSVSVASVARVLALGHQRAMASKVFLAGLLHDVGKLLSMQTAEISYESFLAEDPYCFSLPDAVFLRERDHVGYDHAVLGAHVLQVWEIPDPTPTVVAMHHQLGRAFELDPKVGTMVAILRVANIIDYQMQVSLGLDDEFVARLERDEACDFAGYEARDIEASWRELVEARQATLMEFSGRVH